MTTQLREQTIFTLDHQQGPRPLHDLRWQG